MTVKFIPSHPTLIDACRREACFTLDYSRDRILHCANQLSEEDLWWRPREEMNAVGNILLHVCGNMRQWIICGLGGEEDKRDRPGEFARRDPVPKLELVEKLRLTIEQAKAVISRADEKELLRTRYIQVGDITGAG